MFASFFLLCLCEKPSEKPFRKHLTFTYSTFIIISMLYIIIIVLLAVIGYCLYQLDLYKSYNSYNSKEIDKLEADLETERTINSKTLKELNIVAYTNPITKLGNIDYFMDETKKLFQEQPNADYYLVAFNIQNIGKINQLFGPTEGDNVVLHAARSLRKIGQRERHLFAQIYSNLFGMIIKEKSEEYILSQIKELTELLQGYSENFTVLSSFGIYHITDTRQPIMEMVNACMLAQKFVKDPEQCNYIFYSEELEANFKQNKQMSQEMEEALEQHKFLMYLQPMVDLKTFRVVSAEALVRWDYPGKGILSPYAFIPLFESTNLVQKLDYYMWEECLKTIRRWIDNKIEPTPIAMNISHIHFQNTKFIDYLDDLCEHYLIDKKMLILELPEKGLSNGGPQLKEIIVTLKEHGYTLCIDNFGSMNSPLNLLRDYPIDQIKIDRSFLNKHSDSEEGMSILRYLIAMAKEVGLTVITEGVETLEQTNLLGEIGSDIAQGYFFSKPVNLREFDQLSHSMVQQVYQSNEYYPTFEDLEKDLDLIAFMLGQN